MTIDYEMLVEEFSKEMLKRLLEKREKYGDSWLNVPMNQLRRRVIDEVTEWVTEAFKPDYNKEDEMKELIDIANQCLLLYYRLKEVTE